MCGLVGVGIENNLCQSYFVCSSFSANLPPMPEHYLALLSSISFLVILSKCYLFFVLIYYIVN